jgi:hypothetical protein
MASVIRERVIDADADEVWTVISDFGTGPHRMAPGFVTGTEVEGDTRVVTFGDGSVVRERLVAVDHEARRLAYAVVAGMDGLVHDNASMRVTPEGAGRCRFVWIHDALPDALAPGLAAAMEAGLRVMARTLGRPVTTG